MAKRIQSDDQLSLFGEAVGLAFDKLPVGVSELDSKEVRFLQSLIAHGMLGKAAMEAGYASSIDSGCVQAHKLMLRPRVQRMYRALLQPIAENAQRLILAKTELSIVQNGKAMEAAMRAEEARAALEIFAADTNWQDKESAGAYNICRRNYLDVIAEERTYAKAANETDTLLASLLGKLQLNIHETSHVSVTMGNGFTDAFWQKAQEYRALQRQRTEAARN